MWESCSDFKWIRSKFWVRPFGGSCSVAFWPRCFSPSPRRHLLRVWCQKYKLWMSAITLFALNLFALVFFSSPPLRSLSFIHCHHSFSSRSQTCLLYVIFSFSILTLLVWQYNGWWKGETHKHRMGLTLMMAMLRKKNTGDVIIFLWVFLNFLSFILFITDRLSFCMLFGKPIVHVLQIIVLSNKM